MAACAARRPIPDLNGSAVGQAIAFAGPGRCLLGGHKALHPALDASPVVGAGNDLLARVAAFAEREPLDEIKVQHLCDEGLAGGQVDLGQSRGNIVGMPPGFITWQALRRVAV